MTVLIPAPAFAAKTPRGASIVGRNRGTGLLQVLTAQGRLVSPDPVSGHVHEARQEAFRNRDKERVSDDRHRNAKFHSTGAGFVEFPVELSVPVSGRRTKGGFTKIRGGKSPPVQFPGLSLTRSRAIWRARERQSRTVLK